MVLETILIIGCIRKVEPKKDDFLGTTTEEPKKEEKQKTKIHIIDDGGWTQYQIVEVDGHLYLCNAAHGGIAHLESCPCKSK
jgi:hypothetical protein